MAAAPPRPNYVSRKRAYQDKDGHEWKLWTVQDNKHSVMEDDIRHHAWISHEKKQEEGKETVEEKFALVENCSKDQAQKAKEAMAALLPALSTADVIAPKMMKLATFLVLFAGMALACQPCLDADKLYRKHCNSGDWPLYLPYMTRRQFEHACESWNDMQVLCSDGIVDCIRMGEMLEFGRAQWEFARTEAEKVCPAMSEVHAFMDKYCRVRARTVELKYGLEELYKIEKICDTCRQATCANATRVWELIYPWSIHLRDVFSDRTKA